MDTKKLRQKILDLAIRGKLVPQNPNDEPASVLLERIRAEKERLIAEGKIKRLKKSKSSSSESHYRNFEPPFPIPESWEWVRLEEIIEDFKYGTSAKSFESGKMPVLRMGNLTRDGKISYSDLAYTDSDNDIAEYNLKKGDILFNRTNSCEWVGKSALYDAVVPAIYAGYLIRLRAIMVLSEYLIVVMTSGYYRNWCYSVKTDAVNQSNINATKLSSFVFPLPPLNEQKCIVQAYQSYDKIISSLEIDKIDIANIIARTKSKILDLAMQGRLVPQVPTDEPAVDMLRRINPKAKIITDNPHYPQLPYNWVCTSFTDVCCTALGKTLNKATDQGNLEAYLCSINVKDGYFDLSTIKQTKILPEEFERYSVYKGDLLVCEGGDVGRCAIWQGDRIFFQNALHRIRPLNGIEQRFLLYFLLYSKNNHWIDELCSGVTIKHFTTKAMSSLIIAMPPINEQKRIIEKIENLFELLNAIENALKIK